MAEPDLFFKPWLGEDYTRRPYHLPDGAIYPVHILGESHYTDEPEDRDPDFTRRVVAEHGRGTTRTPFFRQLLRALTTNDKVSAQEADAVWRNVGFSNYVQDFLPAARTAPTRAMWERGHRAFETLLHEHRPLAMLVLGQRLWRSMDKRDSFRLPAENWREVTVDDGRIYPYRVDGKERWMIAMHILHPSAPAFDLGKARERLFIMRAVWQNNVDVTGAFESLDKQRERLEVAP